MLAAALSAAGSAVSGLLGGGARAQQHVHTHTIRPHAAAGLAARGGQRSFVSQAGSDLQPGSKAPEHHNRNTYASAVFTSTTLLPCDVQIAAALCSHLYCVCNHLN